VEQAAVENNATEAKNEEAATEVNTADAPSTDDNATPAKPKRSRRRRPAKDGVKAEAQ
jgi:hypothetical protein